MVSDNADKDLRYGGLVHDLLAGSGKATPNSDAMEDAFGTWTYQELLNHSQAFSAWLDGKGVARGERIVVQLPNIRQTVAVFYGACRRGVVFVPLNPGMKPFHLRSVIADADPRLVIAEDETAADRLRDVTDLPVYSIDSLWADVERLRDAGAGAEAVEVSPEDLAVLIYTSGSTAAPKAVACPHQQIVFAASSINAVLGYHAEDIVFCRMSVSWDFGLYKVLISTLTGAKLVLAGGEPDIALVKSLRESGATMMPIVPSLASMLTTLIRRDPEGAPTLRMFTNSAAALPQVTIDALRSAFPGAQVVRMYGQTECKRISIMPPHLEHERPDSVGLPLPGTTIEILDEDGTLLPPGEPGEITVTGPHVMAGYWRAPEITARAYRRDETTGAMRLHTGDYGHLDEDGFLYFGGRRDDMFKRKGTRMSTVEIEAAALDIPGVTAAVALPPTATRDLALCVASDLEPHDVLRSLAERLEPAKVPATCRIVNDFPLTLNGKSERKQLARLLDGSDK
ncbi:AMP-binding protein [Streptomyces sp. NPDC020965]